MPKGLSERERGVIVALAKDSAEALHATVTRMRKMEDRRPQAKESADSRKWR